MLALCLVSLAWGDSDGAAPPVRQGVRCVAYVPGDDAALDAAVLRGLREGLEAHARAGGSPVTLCVGRRGDAWSHAAPEAVRLVSEEGARVLVSAPDRRIAHLLAQIGTRTQVRVVSTSAVRTVGATGSTWVSVVAGEGDEGLDVAAAERRGAQAAALVLEQLAAEALPPRR